MVIFGRIPVKLNQISDIGSIGLRFTIPVFRSTTLTSPTLTSQTLLTIRLF